METINTVAKIKNIDILKESWELFKKNFWFLIGVQLGVVLLPFILDLIQTGVLALGNALSPESVSRVSLAMILALVIQITRWAFSIILTIGSITIFLKKIRGQETSFSEIFNVRDPHMILKYIGASILLFIILFVGFLVLIIPGIVLTLMFAFVLYLIIDKKMAIIESFQTSKNLTGGYKMQLFIFGLTLLGINILGLLCLGIGLFVTLPFSAFALLYFYNKLLEKSNLSTTSSPSSSIPPTTTETPILVETA